MKTSFTPAPWFIEQVEPLVCSWTFNFEKMNNKGFVSSDEFIANANLIAAAPEMYEMLKYLTDMNPEDTKLYIENSDDILNLLAKARGE